jgi:hypothetical protein
LSNLSHEPIIIWFHEIILNVITKIWKQLVESIQYLFCDCLVKLDRVSNHTLSHQILIEFFSKIISITNSYSSFKSKNDQFVF